MLQIIWGEDWQANRAALLAALCQPGDGQRIWIVPEQASFAAEQQLCRKGGSGICRHAQVLSFTRLANRVFAASGGVARQTLDQGGRVLAMAQALEQVRSRLKRYAAGSRRGAPALRSTKRNRMAHSSALAVETAPAVSFCHSSSPPLRLLAVPEFHAPRIPT